MTDDSAAQPQPQPQPQPEPQPTEGAAAVPTPFVPGPPTEPRRGLPTGAILGIVGGGVAVLLIVIIAAAAVIVPRIAGGGSPSGSPDGVVAAYLKAVAASDAKTALSYIEEANQPQDSSLLTNAALRASHKLGAIKAIKVSKPAKSSGFVDLVARYTIGGTPVTGKFTVDNLNGKWELESGVAALDVGNYFSGVDLTLNGMKVTGDKATVFPGTYVIATTSKYFAVTGTSKVVVKDGYQPPSLEAANLTLSDVGLATFRQAVTAAVAPCLASRTLAAGCGLDLPATLSDGTQLEEGTITRTLSGSGQSTLAGLKDNGYLVDIRKVASESIGSVDVTATCTKGGRRGTCSILLGPILGSATVDFTTDPPTVRWG